MLVSGPVRCVRMVGERDGIQKVIYLFGDVHNSVGEQTSCEMTTTHNANPQKKTTNKLFYNHTAKKCNKN